MNFRAYPTKISEFQGVQLFPNPEEYGDVQFQTIK